MIKIFLTADNHFGRKFDRWAEKDKIIEKRYESFEKMIKKANEEKCNYFVIAGDLFDKTINIAVKDVKQVIDYLKKFEGDVIVLPGNHDYYSGDEEIWKTFLRHSEGFDNIILMRKNEEYKYEEISFFPAFCDDKHSSENKLSLYENHIFDENRFNVLIAHGAIEGLSADMEGQYFMMTERELESLGVDCCLIGHAHIPYPSDLSEDKMTDGYRIFNAGTHSQLDLINNTDGECFIITLSNDGGKKKVEAKKYCSGILRFYNLDVDVANNDLIKSIKDCINETITVDNKNAIVRVNLRGIIRTDEYEKKEQIYEDLLRDFLEYEKSDEELVEEITLEKIKKEFAETSFAYKLLEKLADNPIEQNMAYKMIKETLN